MNRKILLIALIAIFIGYAGWNLSESVTPYVSIAEAEAAKGNVQVKGLLDKSIQPQQIDSEFNFTIKDEESGQTMPVKYKGTKPDQFDSAYHVVAIGKYNADDSSFHANKLLIKCPSKYEDQRGNL